MGRLIEHLANTDAPDSDYLYGRVRDNSGVGDGTPVNEAMMGDILQFFARMLAQAGVTANGQPDNDYSGFQFFEALVKLFQQTQSGDILKTKVIDIGDWDMDTTISIDVAHGLTDRKKIRGTKVTVRNDSDVSYYDLLHGDSGGNMDGSLGFLTGTAGFEDYIRLIRTTSGFFDTSAFSATSYNRGWIVIWYED